MQGTSNVRAFVRKPAQCWSSCASRAGAAQTAPRRAGLLRWRWALAALSAAAAACGGAAPTTQPMAAPAGAAASPSTPSAPAAGTPATAGGSAVTRPSDRAGTSGNTGSVGPSGPAQPMAAGAGAATAGSSATASTAGSSAAPVAGSGAAGAGASEMGPIKCQPRSFTPGGSATLHMHHIHFNTQDPDGGIAFAEKYFNAKPIDFCTDETSPRVTRAIKTERAYFLYTKTAEPPSDMRVNKLAHVGYNHPDVTSELQRMLALDAPLADESVCATAAQGTPCNTVTVLWFYIETPEGARFEIASGPGPATMGFAHIHLIAPTYSFFQNVLGDAFKDPAGNPNVDDVNMISGGRTGMVDPNITYQETRGAPVDHVGFSTTDLEGTLARIEATGVKIEEPISFKPEHGFRSFMVKSPEGVWLEILEDAPFAP